MNISEKNRSKLYEAISEPIMRKRIAIKNSEGVIGLKNAKDIDDLMYRLEREIWVEVRKALNIAGS